MPKRSSNRDPHRLAATADTVSFTTEQRVAEAFVKTIKRDYVAVKPTLDARTVLEQLPK